MGKSYSLLCWNQLTDTKGEEMKQREKKKKNIVLRVIVGILIFVLFLVLVV